MTGHLTAIASCRRGRAQWRKVRRQEITTPCFHPDVAIGSTAMSIPELQAAVTVLSEEDLDRFSRWLEEYRADLWDLRIEADIQAGRLDEAGRRADEDFEAGRCSPLR